MGRWFEGRREREKRRRWSGRTARRAGGGRDSQPSTRDERPTPPLHKRGAGAELLRFCSKSPKSPPTEFLPLSFSQDGSERTRPPPVRFQKAPPAHLPPLPASPARTKPPASRPSPPPSLPLPRGDNPALSFHSVFLPWRSVPPPYRQRGSRETHRTLN